MSLVVIPVCACCEKPSKRSGSCTACFRICCIACFGELMELAITVGVSIARVKTRICQKCHNNIRDQTIRTRRNATAGLNVCQVHGQVCCLFCVNCSVEICGVCLTPDEPHDLHQVSNLTAVYREKVSTVESKLAQAYKLNEDVNADAKVYGRNLELLEKEVADAVAKVDAIYKNCKREVSTSSNGRIRALKVKLKTLAEHEAAVDELQHRIEQLSMGDFMQLHLDIDQKCDQLLAEQTPITLQKVDIDCGLIPPYCYETFVFRGFSNTDNAAIRDVNLTTIFHVQWKFSMRKGKMLQIEPRSKIPSRFDHEMVVIIPHKNYTKGVRKTFSLEGATFDKVFDVIEVSHIVENEFCSDEGDLVVKIGIRPVNAVIESRMLRYLFSSDDAAENAFFYNFRIMHFKPKLSNIQSGKRLFSFHIKDENGCNWRMHVTLNHPNLEAYVQLIGGCSVGSCNFFIELKHKDPKKSLIMCSSEKRCFETSISWGWKEFILSAELTNDDGFHPNGILNFRFGVRPLSTNTESDEACSANA